MWLAVLAVAFTVLVVCCDARRVDVGAAEPWFQLGPDHVVRFLNVGRAPDLTWLGLIQRVVIVATASVAAMFVGSAHVGWYFASAARFHNNELGGAARG